MTVFVVCTYNDYTGTPAPIFEHFGILTRAGHEIVAQARTLEDAMRAIESGAIDGVELAIIDSRLMEWELFGRDAIPQLDGRDVCKALRARVPKIKILASAVKLPKTDDYADIFGNYDSGGISDMLARLQQL